MTQEQAERIAAAFNDLRAIFSGYHLDIQIGRIGTYIEALGSSARKGAWQAVAGQVAEPLEAALLRLSAQLMLADVAATKPQAEKGEQ